ncbi:MAG: hypothetical protein ACQEQX_06605 [Thermodesulfobacteriota bacterium]
MNRYLAILLLVLIFLGLAHSTYSFFQGNFGEGILIFPLLAGCYVFFLARDSQEEKGKEQERDTDQD